MNHRFFAGDVFQVHLDQSVVGFFQYVARDPSQLNSHVARVFKRKHKEDDIPDLADVVRGEVAFHAHVFLGVGSKQGLWRMVGRCDVVGAVDVLFRHSNDYGKSKRQTSSDWYVWKIDGPYEQVGALRGDLRRAEFGVVVPPDSLVYRMNNEAYDFFYPESA